MISLSSTHYFWATVEFHAPCPMYSGQSGGMGSPCRGRQRPAACTLGAGGTTGPGPLAAGGKSGIGVGGRGCCGWWWQTRWQEANVALNRYR